MGAEVIAGPSNSVVIDKQRMYWMAGKVCPRFRLASPTLTHRLLIKVEEYWRWYVVGRSITQSVC